MITLLSALVLSPALGLAPQQSTTIAVIGQPAPSFSLKGADGKSYALKDYSGHYVVLEWTNCDCPYVHKHYDSGNMQATQKKARAMGAVWFTVSTSAPGRAGYLTPEGHLAHMKQVHSNATMTLLDSQGVVGKLYGARATPQIVVIDPKGTEIYNGAIDDKPTADPDDIKTAKNYPLLALEESMAGKPVAVPTSRPYGCGIKY